MKALLRAVRQVLSWDPGVFPGEKQAVAGLPTDKVIFADPSVKLPELVIALTVLVAGAVAAEHVGLHVG